MDILLLFGIILAGFILGGIVNVLADDLPQRRAPRLPHYPDDTPRPLHAWLGTTAFLLGARKSPSGSTLGWRYPLAEWSTVGLMLLAIVMKGSKPDISTLQLVFYLVYMALFVLITVIDIEHRLILFIVVIPSSLLAILDAVLTPANSRPDVGESLLGGLLGFSVFFVLYLGGILFSYIVARIQGHELPEVAFGYGDVMLSTVCGLILGWQPLIFAMFITVFVGAFGAIIYLVTRAISGRYDMFTPLPYGPYIVLGTLIMLLFNDQIRMFLQGA